MKRLTIMCLLVLCGFAIGVTPLKPARAQSTAPLPATSADVLITGSGFRATIVPGRSITIYADHKRVNVRPALMGDESVIEIDTSQLPVH